jgi:hypothetical protein
MWQSHLRLPRCARNDIKIKMLSHRSKIYLAITVMLVAVILIVFGLTKFFSQPKIVEQKNIPATGEVIKFRHPLTGQPLASQPAGFFAVAIMIDNAYNIRPQVGLAKADIIYESLVEGNITRLMAIFASQTNSDKVGPVRSARNYFMDWAEEYQGIYMHVGGSPQALGVIKNYNFTNIDQIGAGEIYFWRDQKLSMPHNVFTSSANWLRVGELKNVASLSAEASQKIIWNFTEATSTAQLPVDFKINFSSVYNVEWRFNKTLNIYQRWQGDDRFFYDNGEQAQANNIIVQVVKSRFIDTERRAMDTQVGGQAFIFNSLGKQAGQWKYVNGRTKFFDADNKELKLVPGQTWVEVIPSAEMLVE